MLTPLFPVGNQTNGGENKKQQTFNGRETGWLDVGCSMFSNGRKQNSRRVARDG
jgi:hypothetical protein